MVDLHTHILFDIDDGPKAIDESLSLLNKATQSGVTTFVTTSHYYSARTPFADFVSKRNARFESLRKACAEQELPVRLLRGAEIHIDPLLLNQPDFHDLCFEGTNHALLEIQHSATQLEEALLLIDRIMSYFNVVPIIAHVERYPFLRKMRNLAKLRELGCFIQIDAECLLGSFFDRRFAFMALEAGYVDVIASDCHDTIKRPPNLADAYAVVDKRCGTEAVQRLQKNAKRLVFPNKA